MAVRVLLAPQFKQQRHHHGSSHMGPMHLGMAPRAERDHQPEDRPARYPVVHCDRALPSPGSSADTAAVAVPRQDRLPQAPEVRFILPAKRVANRAQAPRQDASASAGAMERALGRLLHFVISSFTAKSGCVLRIQVSTNPRNSAAFPSSSEANWQNQRV